MKTRSGSRILKILCIAAVFVLMLTLCGCRTRITNNSEVNNVMYDDGGFMQEEYDSRREELDLTTAKKPVFTGLGNPEEEEEYEYGDDGEALEDYEPDDYEEDVDDSDPPQANTTGSNSTTGNRRIVKRTTTTIITVTLNPNGGKCKTKSIAVRNGGKYGILPTPTRDGYTFTGWFTKKDDDKGKKVTSSTKVSATKNHTLYAHWKEGEEKKDEDKKPTEPTTPTTPTEETKQEFTVTFDLNGSDATFTEGGGNLTVKDGETYGSLPKAERPKYKFKGWSTSSSGTSTVSSGDKVTQSHTLYAVWDEDSKGYWEAQLADSVKAADKYSYKSLDGKNDSFLQDSGLSKGKNPDFLVVFGNESDAEKADTKEDNPNHTRILYIPKSDAGGKKELIHKIYVFNYLYSGLDAAQAEEDLGVSDEDYFNKIGEYESSWTDDGGDDGGGSGDGGDGGSGDGGAGEGTEP